MRYEKKVLKYFPYSFREYQREAVLFIYNSIKSGYRNIMFHAPTGFGKTPVVLAAVLPYIMRGYSVIWSVRTGNETDRPIEEIKVFVEKLGLKIFALSFRGKRDMCLLAREKFREGVGYDEASFICKNFREKCPYYINLSRMLMLYRIFNKPLMYSEILEKCSKLKICPYFTQRYLIPDADIISFSYNYVLDERVKWSIKPLIDFKKTILVIDEAHNLQNINLNSDKITFRTVENSIREAEEYGFDDIIDILKSIYDRMRQIYTYISRNGLEDIEFDPIDFLHIVDYNTLRSMEQYGQYVRRSRLQEGKRPRSSLYHLSSFLKLVYDNIDVKGIAFIASIDRDNLILEVWDMRSAEILKNVWREFYARIFISGTLNPVEAFAEIVGVSRYRKQIIPSIYERKNILALTLRGISTRGEELSETMAKKYITAIELFIKNFNSNIAIFTASYRIQDELMKNGLLKMIQKYDRKIFIEKRELRGENARKMLDEFKKSAESDTKGILIAPMGGRFAEGSDYPGKTLEGIFLVGIPFDRVTARTRKYLEYYTEIYGKEKGRYYGYILPALRRASQALGRALRSRDDKAILICGDERYLKFLNLLPDYFVENNFIVRYDRIDEIIEKWVKEKYNIL